MSTCACCVRGLQRARGGVSDHESFDHLQSTFRELTLDCLACSLRGGKGKQVSEGEWISAERMVRVTRQRGKPIMSMGLLRKKYKKYGSSRWLHPEEALFLLDQGNLSVRLDDGRTVTTPEAAFSHFLSVPSPHKHVGLLDLFAVYAYLRRLGFVVRRHTDAAATNMERAGRRHSYGRRKKRHSGWMPDGIVRRDACPRGWWEDIAVDAETSIPQLRNSAKRLLRERERKRQSSMKPPGSTIPLIDQLCLEDGDEIDIGEVYRALQVIGLDAQREQRESQKTDDDSSTASFQITYDLWKPGMVPSDKNLVPPMGSIVIVRADDSVPTLSELDRLISESHSDDQVIYFAMVEDGSVTFSKFQCTDLSTSQ